MPGVLVLMCALTLFLAQTVLAQTPGAAQIISARQATCPHQGPAHLPPPSALARKLAALALAEHQAFNGHRINVAGYLWFAGPGESETEALQPPVLPSPDAGTRSGENGSETSLPSPEQAAISPAIVPDRLVWRRVWTYWEALARHVPGQTAVLPVKWLPELLARRDSPEPLRRTRLALLTPLLATLPADDHSEAIRQATIRAALNDTPWSAAFVSYLMDQAGLGETQFEFSEGHVHYIRAAFAATAAPAGSPYAYRACDVQKTTVQTGDLLCYGRGQTAPQTFADWQQAMAQPGRFAAAHCELVVEVSPRARRLQLVGGNVLQSVALRELALDQRGRLSRRHVSLPARQDSYPDTPLSAPDPFSPAARQDFNRHPWAVLLKLQALPESGGH